VYKVGLLPSMTKGEIVGHSFIDVLSLLSTDDVIDVMISWYDELSLVSTVLWLMSNSCTMCRDKILGGLENKYQSSEEMAR
jgi:hypothetical protein